MFAPLIQVLIKKSYDRTRRIKRRNWKLKELHRDREGVDTDDERYERSLRSSSTREKTGVRLESEL